MCSYVPFKVIWYTHSRSPTCIRQKKKNVNPTSSKGQLTLLGDPDTLVNEVERIRPLRTHSCSTNSLLGKMMLLSSLSPQQCLAQGWHTVGIPYLWNEWVNPRWGIKWSYTVKITFQFSLLLARLHKKNHTKPHPISIYCSDVRLDGSVTFAWLTFGAQM